MGFTCEIKFTDNPSGIFFAGQTLTGKVELRLDKLTKIQIIKLTVRGFSKCAWTTGTGDNKKRYEDQENYFESITTLLSSGSEPVSIPMGIQTYTFACALPPLVPSSFEGKHGHIRYQVSVTVERPWKSDHTSLANFAVINQCNLNTAEPSLRNPAETEIVKTFCCGPCQSGELTIRVKLPRSAFIPGESLPVEVYVKNDSDVRVIKMNLYLNKRIAYRTFQSRKGEEKERVQLAKEKLDGTPTFSTKVFNKHFIVPAVTASNTGLCKLITLEYEIKAYARTPCGHMDIQMYIPIVIGTIGYTVPMHYDNTIPITTQPMLQSIPQIPMPQSHHIGFAFQQPAEASLTQFLNANTDPSAPPPTYEETVYGQKNITEKLLH